MSSQLNGQMSGRLSDQQARLRTRIGAQRGMRGTDRTAIAVVIAVALAAGTLTPLTQDHSYLLPSWLLIAVMGAISVLLRRIGARSMITFAAQLVVWIAVVLAAAAGTVSTVVTDESVGLPGHLVDLYAQAVGHMQNESAPMSADGAVRWLLISALGLIAIIADVLVLGLRRPAFGIAPTAAVFLIPALGLDVDTGVWPLLLIAVGYLGILVAGGLNANSRWTRGLSRDSADTYGSADPVVWRAAGYIGAPAVVLTLIFGVLLPTIDLSGVGFGFGNGPGGNGPIQLADPTLDLKRNLTEPTNRPVLTYRTTKNRPQYLRLASLPAFSSAGWTNTETPIQTGSDMPAVPGLADASGADRSTTISISDFDSEYLPMPYAPRHFDAAGNWAIDPNSLVVISTDNSSRKRSRATRNLTYTVQSQDVTPTATELADSSVGTPVDSAVTTAVPKDLPASITELAKRITAKATTPAGRASAIQEYLRSPDNFTYSTDPRPGSGYRALTNFLFVDKKGYCEQFAATMALMARIEGIPSRVAVGFLPGEQNGNSWTVSVRDMHAWPELYFSGYGWVRYEPTPSTVTGSAPSWSLAGNVRQQTSPSTGPSAESSAPSVAPRNPNQNQGDHAQNQADTTSSGHLLRNGLIGAGALVLLLILAAPASIRLRRRSTRFDSDQPAADQVESAWSEVRDTVIDLGGRWPAGSPRTIGSEVSAGLDPDDSAAMGQLAVLVERSRYAEAFAETEPTAELSAITGDIRRGMAEPLPWHRRLRATLIPRSVFRRKVR